MGQFIELMDSQAKAEGIHPLILAPEPKMMMLLEYLSFVLPALLPNNHPSHLLIFPFLSVSDSPKHFLVSYSMKHNMSTCTVREEEASRESPLSPLKCFCLEDGSCVYRLSVPWSPLLL